MNDIFRNEIITELVHGLIDFLYHMQVIVSIPRLRNMHSKGRFCYIAAMAGLFKQMKMSP